MNEGRVAFPEDLSDTERNVLRHHVDLNATVGTSVGVNTTWGGWANVTYSLAGTRRVAASPSTPRPVP